MRRGPKPRKLGGASLAPAAVELVHGGGVQHRIVSLRFSTIAGCLGYKVVLIGLAVQDELPPHHVRKPLAVEWLKACHCWDPSGSGAR